MKKFFLSFALLFVSSALFAQTAQDVYVKMSKADFSNRIATTKSYETEYEYECQSSPNTKMYYKETVNGINRRMDIKSVSPKKTTYCSIILSAEADYVSTRAVMDGDKMEFAGYQEIKNASSVRTLAKETRGMPDPAVINISFDNSEEKNSSEYVIKLTSKNKEEAIEKYKKAQKEAQKGENPEYTALDHASLWYAMFDILFRVDKQKFLPNRFTAKIDEDAVYEMMKDSDEWKDKPEKEKREAAKEAANAMSAFTNCEGIMSDYRKIEKTDSYYPFEITLKSLNTEKGEKIIMHMKTSSFKILDGANTDNSIFTPSSIKKGYANVPREFTFYGNFMSSMMDDMKKEIRESAKEAIKEQAKEDVKSSIKSGIKGSVRGLRGF
ncbi:MAG: hypothetical protein FWH43_01210 [Endomicrobia bacterium]|nr:hypothetical protein [Endomicrobiia bacterium]